MLSRWMAVSCLAGLVVLGGALRSFTSEEEESSARAGGERPLVAGPVTITGVLKRVSTSTAETTGFEIRLEDLKGVIWELESAEGKKALDNAGGLQGKPVAATGTLEIRRGEQRKVRFIVKVSRLKKVDQPR